jgi:hypothetical protein
MPIEVVHWSGAGILAMDLLREMVKGAVGDEG